MKPRPLLIKVDVKEIIDVALSIILHKEHKNVHQITMKISPNPLRINKTTTTALLKDILKCQL